ncbi:MAG: hypothetical protein HXS48_18645 [Theionarchaea archaeon]|nr:hypothetical protein [Theionarchaea archaeon]
MRSRFISLQWEKDKLWLEKDTYLYLGWTDSRNITGLAMSSYPLHLPNVIESDVFSMIDSFDPNFFIFSSEFFHQALGSPIEKSNVIVLKRDRILILPNQQNQFSREDTFVEKDVHNDVKNEEMCPLRHLLLLSNTLDEKQLSSFQLAVKYGFPEVDLVDFSKKTIKAGKEEITSKWDSIISDQKGTLEEDFVRTLRSALKSFVNEYLLLFEKIHSIIPPGDYSEYSLTPLFELIPYITLKKSLIVPIQPRIGIRSLRFEAIFKLEEENLSDFMITVKKKLTSDLLEVTVNEMGRFQVKDTEMPDKKYYRVRISIILETASDPISLESGTMLTNELAYLIVEEALYEISDESYKNYRKHKIPEFWLKNAGISIEIPPFMIDKAEEIIRSNFGSYFDTSHSIKHRRSADKVEVVFYLYFSSGYDYVIERRDEGLFPNIQAGDPYTRIGIEHLMRKEFTQAMKSFRKAERGLLRDYYDITSFSELDREAQRKFINRMRKYCSTSDFPTKELFSSSGYTDERNPKKILGMLRATNDWIRTTTRLHQVEILEKQIRLQQLNEEEYANAMEMVRGFLKKTKIRFFKNFFNFVEDIGSFYVDLLQETEKEAPESVKEWMRLTI